MSLDFYLGLRPSMEVWTGTLEYFELPPFVLVSEETKQNFKIGTAVAFNSTDDTQFSRVGSVIEVLHDGCRVRWEDENVEEERKFHELTVKTPQLEIPADQQISATEQATQGEATASETNETTSNNTSEASPVLSSLPVLNAGSPIPSTPASIFALIPKPGTPSSNRVRQPNRSFSLTCEVLSSNQDAPVATTTPPPSTTQPPLKVLEKKRIVLEPARFGQKVILGVLVSLDFKAKGNKVTGFMELPEFRARIAIEGAYNLELNELILEEKSLIAGRSADWSCRFGKDYFCSGTKYVLSRKNHDEMSSEFYSLDTNDPRPRGILKLQRKRLFYLSSDLRSSSTIVPKEERTTVKLSRLEGDSDRSGLALAEVGFSRGVHYWEVTIDFAGDHGTVFIGVIERPQAPIYPTGVPAMNVNRWEKIPSWGFVNFRATQCSLNGGSETIYGEFFETGDTVGVLLDLDIGEISFFIDALKFGEHVMRDLGPAFFPNNLTSRNPIKWNPTGEMQFLYPAIGLKRFSDNAVSVSSKYISFPATESIDQVKNMSLLYQLLKGHFKVSSDEEDAHHGQVIDTNNLLPQKRLKLPQWFVQKAYAHYLRWSENRYRLVQSRAGGRFVEIDISQEAMINACKNHVDPPLFVGEKVKVFQNQGRELSIPENAIVLGTRLNRIWYSIVSVSNHEGFSHGATWAFYWEPEELGALLREDSPKSTATISNKILPILSREEFEESTCGEDWTFEMDFDLVRIVNHILQREGEQDAMNLNFQSELSNPIFFAKTKKSEIMVKGRVAVLRLFNCMLKAALPFFAAANQTNNMEDRRNGFSTWAHRSRQLIFSSCKRSFWEAVLKATTTGTTLSSEEYVDPPQIRLLPINRIKAVPAILATVSNESKRMKRSVFGQLYAELMKWPDYAFRRAYCGKGHGGQKRAFKLKLIGEGVEDYGGPYRQAFEVVCDELQCDTEWPISKRACLLPLFIPCPNRYSGVGDGRDKYVLNPSARSASLLRRFEFLGKLMGIAVRHGLQLGLNLPILFWRNLVGLPITRKHLEEIDTAFVRDLKTIESATAANFNDLIGTDRKFQVVLSDGNVVGADDSPTLTYENAKEYIKFALDTRIKECETQMTALKKGLAAVLPIEHFSLFTAEELEILFCGRTGFDVELLKSITEYEGVEASDQHVKWLWEVLEEMSLEDRIAFLKFVWARSRMPSKSEMSTAFRLQQPSGGAAEKPDNYLPCAQTCFFILSLPRYSSKEILRKKLLQAIDCTLMDADVRLRTAEGWAEI